MVILAFNGVECKTEQMQDNARPHFNAPYSFILDEQVQHDLALVDEEEDGSAKGKTASLKKEAAKSAEQSTSESTEACKPSMCTVKYATDPHHD